MEVRRWRAGLVFAVVLLWARLVAAEGNGDVLGSWNLELEDAGTTIQPTPTVRDGGVLEGTWSGPRGTLAAVLAITPRPVAFHKYRVMKSLGIRTTAELIQVAVRHRIV